MTEMQKMRPSEIKDAIKACYKAGVPPYVQGPPGVGKTAVFHQAAVELGIGYIPQHVSTMEPVDARGIPVQDEERGTTRWPGPDFLPRIERDGDRGLLHFDELVSGVPAVMAALFPAFYPDGQGKRHLGECEILPGWLPCGSGNRLGDRGVVYRMPTPLSKRVCFMEMDAHFDDWVQWALDNGVHPKVIAYLRFNTAAFNRFDPNESVGPDPRS